MFEFETPKQFVGKNLVELDLRKKYDMNIVGIKNPKEKSTLNPNPTTIIESGSVLFAISRMDKMNLFYKLLEK